MCWIFVASGMRAGSTGAELDPVAEEAEQAAFRSSTDAAAHAVTREVMERLYLTGSSGSPPIPEVVEPRGLDDYLEVMTRAVFQAGVSWKQIAAQWDSYREAFQAFDTAAVAAFGEADIERVLATSGILRMPRKVRASIANARALLEMQKTFGDMNAYVGSFAGYPALVKDFKKRFSFMGDMNVWYVLFRTGHGVPRFEEWLTTIPGDHPRMREMVDLARAAGKSREY